MNKIIFDKMALQVLSKQQQKLKPLLEEFSKTHFLVGGTAIALRLQHRTSIDFDLFTMNPQGTGKELFKRIEKLGFTLEKESDLRYLSDEEEHEATLYIHGVKVQLIHFNRNPLNINVKLEANNILCNGLPTIQLLDLAALKVFAMMYRTKWKDAVDLYFLLQSGLKIQDIIKRAKNIFTSLYKEEATLENIIDNAWDKNETVEYITKKPPTDDVVQKFLESKVKEYCK